jgi:hypothetical protein
LLRRLFGITALELAQANSLAPKGEGWGRVGVRGLRSQL